MKIDSRSTLLLLVLAAASGCAGGNPSAAQASAEAEQSVNAGTYVDSSKTRASSTASDPASVATASAPASSPSAASSASASSAAAVEVAINKRYPKVGDKTRTTKIKTVALKAHVKGPKGPAMDIETADDETLETTEECLAVADKQCSKLRVTFVTHDKKRAFNGKSNDVSPSTAGKTYIVARQGSGVKVTLASGSPAPSAEEEEVKDNYKRLGRKKDVLATIPDKVKVGDSLDAFAKAVAEEAATSDEVDAPTVTAKITVKGVREVNGNKVVTLDVRMSIEGDRPKVGHMKINMTGTVDMLAATAQDIGSDFSGPVEMAFKNDGGSGLGTMTSKETISHDP